MHRALWVLAASVFFALGVIAEQRLNLAWQLKSSLSSKAKPTLNSAEGDPSRALASALLPLKIETVKIKSDAELAKEAGAICSFGKQVIISDRQAKFFSYAIENRVLTKLDWPILENNYAAFLNSEKSKHKEFFRLHGLACPIWKNERRIIAAHEVFDPAVQATRFTVSMLTLKAGLESTIGSWRIVYQSEPIKYRTAKVYGGHTAGGRVVFDKNNGIYISIGEYGLTQDEKAENDPNLGSIIHLDLESSAVTQVSVGHRNPQGLTLLGSGELLSTEHAQRGGDELNLIEQGSNYGWPTVTYGTDYETYDWPSNPVVGKHDGFKKPLYAWVPSLGISQLVQVTNFHQRWNSDILVSSLKAGTLSRVRYEEGAVRYVEPIWIGPRLRDIVEAEDRRIILWTDSAELLFLTVDETELARNSRQMHSVVQPANVSCMNCHHAGPTNPTHAAPSLSKIIGRPIASDNFANYSPALKAKGGVWSEDNLRLFLADPQKFSPGTSMAISEMTNRDLNEVLKFLRALD